MITKPPYPTNLCGIDEAGRGSLAGPLVVSGVVLLDTIDGVADSKKVSPSKREELYTQIIKNAIVKALFIDNKFIDKYGISKALQLAIIELKIHFYGHPIIFDGNCSYGVSGIKTMVKADESVACVSAASIVSKVLRDRFMMRMGKKYKEYLFEKHKGYGTKEHFEKIAIYGISPLHRITFLGNAN